MPRGRPQAREVQISKALSLLLRHRAETEGVKIDTQGYANVKDVVRSLSLRHLYRPHWPRQTNGPQLEWKRLKSLKVTLAEIKEAVGSSDKQRFALLHIPSAKASASVAQKKSVPAVLAAGAAQDQPPTAILEAAVPSTSEGQRTATQQALSVKDNNPSNFFIRATQGHSMKNVDAASFLEPLSLSDESKLPATVVHGTFHSTWPAILRSGGLRCMGRNHVHFATGPSLESVLPTHKDGTPHANTALGDHNAAATQNDGRVISGMRKDAQVLIYLDIRKALAVGCPFWRSENGVILSEGIPVSKGADDGEVQKLVSVDFFDVVVERKVGLGKLWEHGQELQTLPERLTSRGNMKGWR